VKYLPLFHHFKAIYQFPKHIIFLVKIVALNIIMFITFFHIIGEGWSSLSARPYAKPWYLLNLEEFIEVHAIVLHRQKGLYR
jgi:hypothetical protein